MVPVVIDLGQQVIGSTRVLLRSALCRLGLLARGDAVELAPLLDDVRTIFTILDLENGDAPGPAVARAGGGGIADTGSPEEVSGAAIRLINVLGVVERNWHAPIDVDGFVEEHGPAQQIDDLPTPAAAVNAAAI
jgi:hypothetical protein